MLDLGEQCLTGVFPRRPGTALTRGPLQLVRCQCDDGRDHCGLVQLSVSYPALEMYGAGYGYRSGLNQSMVDHLRRKAQWLVQRAGPTAGDLILDIGSNDGTLLSFMPESGVVLVGMDPAADKFGRYYPGHVLRIADFFSAAAWRRQLGERRARLVTSIAMFYDMEDPLDFARQVRQVLTDDGYWHLEQSYLPLMLARNAYDTVCHEHVEYYALRQLNWIFERSDLRLIDVELNDVNGGSFAVTAVPKASPVPANRAAVDAVAAAEQADGLHLASTYEAFARRVERHRDDLLRTLAELRARGRTVIGYGASTKGNVLLQYCGLGPRELPVIADVNPDKFGCFTPGTDIPIISESEAKAMHPDCLLVLPWHFRANLIERERDFLRAGGSMLFPLPVIEMVGP